MWCLPGGHIDEYEAAVDAVKREVSEETGLTLHPWFYTYFNEIIEAQAIHAVVLVFEGFATGTPRPEPAEVSAMRWFSVDEARKMDLAFTHGEILDAYAGRLVQTDSLD
jgi:8-oxo-dGTP diphosphatase